ncbi:Uncharacterised protein [Pseudomonas luteola]|uniref:Uncharacterized protein n=1 Tax=Pseudomonas luteola TaxID=47886 RepID=A0A2X2D9G2_PSELU|nr:hypothetical protein SAMN05216295_11258 [Pseudomonas zeshuii]SPZ16818.1 Uncharacterised protein [Pseudomonas luteola]
MVRQYREIRSAHEYKENTKRLRTTWDQTSVLIFVTM